ncbi:hypothetical protein FGO68_gene3969 [Halteria grandinella]|uniref:Uncharacterized protein n=1 Tax=Halteria grandinella TaxID=5974 RepID=A0A8J8TA23_HALGN|nr:hypothetical protein FGO68_gene3969 [Halteria grandinella]
MQKMSSSGKALNESDNQSGVDYNRAGKQKIHVSERRGLISKIRRFKSLVKDLDIYARPVNMTFRGRDKFYSLFGGIVSIILLILITVVFFFKLNDVINFNRTQIKKNTLVSISNSYTPPQSLSEKNITIAFMLSDFWGENVLDDPRYGKFKLSQFINYITPEGRIFTDQPIPFSKCKYGVNFFYHSYDEIKDYGIENYFCPDLQNLTLQGNWHAPVFAGIVLDWQRCSQDMKSANYYPGCVNDTVFKEWFREATLQEIAISSYFDGNDYQNPIKYFLDDMWVSLQYGRSVIYDSYFKKNIIQLTDDQFGLFSETKQDHFFQRSKADYFTSDDEKGPGLGNYLHQAFKLDKEYDIYERKVYTISGVLQDVGGIYNSLFFIGLIIYTYSQFQHALFFTGIISKIYMVENPQVIEGPVGKTLGSNAGTKNGKDKIAKIQPIRKISDKFQTQINTKKTMGGKIDGISSKQKFKVPPATLFGGDLEKIRHKPHVPNLGGSLSGLPIMHNLEMVYREKVKDMVVNDLTMPAVSGDGKMQEYTVQRLKDHLYKTRQPLCQFYFLHSQFIQVEIMKKVTQFQHSSFPHHAKIFISA